MLSQGNRLLHSAVATGEPHDNQQWNLRDTPPEAFFFFFFGSGVCRLAGQVSWSNLGLHMHLRQARVSWVALLTLAVLSHTLGP